MAWIDVTGWIENGMWSYSRVYPGARISECPHPPELPSSYEVYCQKFEIGGQTGTYIETEAHVDPSARAVSDCPIADFVMEAAVLRTPPKKSNEPVRIEDLQAAGVSIPRDGAVIIATGWDAHWHEPEYYIEASPYISREAALWLFDQNIRCLAGDLPLFDNRREPCFPWAQLWERVPYLLAPLVNVYPHRFTRGRLYAFPLKIRGAMGTPVRAVMEVATD